MKLRHLFPYLLTAILVGLSLHSAAQTPKPAATGNLAAATGGCFVAHFKSLVLKTHHPETRATVAEDWLHRYAASCSREQLASIQANSPNWLGTALTLEVSSIIDATMEAKAAGNPAMLAQMYESAGQTFQAGTVSHTNPAPRAPVVPPPANNMPLSGAVNYGNMAGNTNINNQSAPPAQPASTPSTAPGTAPSTAPATTPGKAPAAAPAGPLPPKTK